MDLEKLPCSFSPFPTDSTAIKEGISLQNPRKGHQVYQERLNLPKCCTLASIFSAEVLNLPFLPHYQESAKLSLVSSVENSRDPMVKECVALLFNPEFIAQNQFPSECPSLLQMARESISQLTESCKSPSVKTVLKKSLHKQHIDFWKYSRLDQLQVQSKFKDIVVLEPESRTWNRLITGLPAGQLSFLL